MDNLDDLTKSLLKKYFSQIANLNGIGVDDISSNFNVKQSVATSLYKNVQKSVDFLNRINFVPRKLQQGRKVGLKGKPNAGRTNTNLKDRETRSLFGLTEHGYYCRQTDFDTHLTYDELDQWRHDPQFQLLIRDALIESQGLALLMMGFNGVKWAEQTDIEANPLMQDVNIGWLEKIRQEAPSQVFNEGGTAGKITVGKGGDFANIDELVVDASRSFLGDIYKKDKRICVISSETVTASRTLSLVAATDKATEVEAMEKIVDSDKIANREVLEPSYFVDNTILLTIPKNLAVYHQEGARRRRIEDNAKRSRYENFESDNIDFIVEDYNAAVLIENIEII